MNQIIYNLNITISQLYEQLGRIHCNYKKIPYGGSMSKINAYRRGCSWTLLNVSAASSDDILPVPKRKKFIRQSVFEMQLIRKTLLDVAFCEKNIFLLNTALTGRLSSLVYRSIVKYVDG